MLEAMQERKLCSQGRFQPCNKMMGVLVGRLQLGWLQPDLISLSYESLTIMFFAVSR